MTTFTSLNATDRELLEGSRELGIYVLRLIYDWKIWVHRRVEQIVFTGTVTYQRRVSIDFTIPNFKTPLGTESAETRPLFCVPLALVGKRRLRRFSLSDETGRALPLLTQRESGLIATAVLMAAARDVMREGGDVPDSLYDDLWAIAHATSGSAHRSRERLRQVRNPDDPREVAWRTALAGSLPFRVLAADLSINFIVLTRIAGDFGQRRVLKLEYEEEGEVPDVPLVATVRRAWKERPGLSGLGDRHRARRSRHRHKRAMAARAQLDDCGTLTVAARGPRPLAGVTVTVSRHDTLVSATTTGRNGNAVFTLAAGDYHVHAERPQGDSTVSVPVGQVAIEPRTTLPKRVHFPAPPGTDPSGSMVDLAHTVTRSIGWRARPIIFLTPAIGHCGSYHLEVEPPEGLKLTRARLETGASPVGPPGSLPEPDVERRAMQRTHLHLSGVPQHLSGFGMVHLRPRASLIVRAGFTSALITTLLLLVTTLLHARLVGVVGSAATLLLFVPGGLSAYVAGGRENQLTTSMVFGVRLLTIATGFLALIAASTTIFSRRWRYDDTKHTMIPGHEWGAAVWILGATTLIAGAITIVLALTWIHTRRMPEQRSG